MNFTEKDILQALSKVEDPDSKRDLVRLNMIRDVKAEPGQVSFTVVLTTPACPLKDKIRQDCYDAVEAVVGETIEINITMTSSVTTTRSNTPLLPGVKNIIAIASGKGGVGKSTVTANLAVALAKTGAKVGLIDADIYGPSVPTMFNCEHEQPAVEQVNGKNMIVPLEQYDVKLLSIGFLAPPDSAMIWRGPMASSALKQFFSDALWGDLDYLLIDLPPGTGDIHLTFSAVLRRRTSFPKRSLGKSLVLTVLIVHQRPSAMNVSLSSGKDRRIYVCNNLHQAAFIVLIDIWISGEEILKCLFWLR